MSARLKNHYVKIGTTQTLPSNTHGIVLNAIPSDRLFIKDDAINYVLNHIEARGVFQNRSGVANIIDELAKLGFLSEFSGIVLENKLRL